ncbi:MAG: restriction endonuclease, SacI family [Chloroflexi bacterium]|nr:restriction endonuclease, SacI family [Chloroflexota bacterium]
MPIDYESARRLLKKTFSKAEADLLNGVDPGVNEQVCEACKVLFISPTQAYREVFLGCLIARIQDRNINIRQPYIKQGPGAFNGRTLDEKVINPFLQEQRVPSSRGPYLSVFRRSVQFDASTREGLRDKEGYDALLRVIQYVGSLLDDAELLRSLHYLLYKFAELREKARIPLSRLQRLSLDQYDALLAGLIETPSGGRFPVLVVVATFRAIKEFFGLDWRIEWQGINVADTASGAGGDIRVASGDRVLMVAEVTERPIDRSRVVATFTTKIAPFEIENYLFFVKSSAPTPEAKQQAYRYFAQGHEVNFLEIKSWILMVLATIGKQGRAIFNKVLLELLDSRDVPAALKVTWNELITKIASGQDTARVREQ